MNLPSMKELIEPLAILLALHYRVFPVIIQVELNEKILRASPSDRTHDWNRAIERNLLKVPELLEPVFFDLFI